MGDREKSSEYNRPSRPNVDTISYLRGLPLDIESAKSEVSTFLNQELKDKPEIEFPQGLAAALSTIDEVRMEIASLAGDEHGSKCLEILACIAAPFSETAARALLAACSGYYLHLATHRYGSHVVQTFLQLAVMSSSDEDLALHADAPTFTNSPDDLPTLRELIQEIAAELCPHTTQLAIHVCGSHVLRSLLCVLGGVDLVSSSGPPGQDKEGNRGRRKDKKKKKKQQSKEPEAPHAGTMRIVYTKNTRINPNQFQSLLEELALSLLGVPSTSPGELQEHACHPSAGPLLVILLRVLTYVGNRHIPTQEGVVNDMTILNFRLGIPVQEPTFTSGSLASKMAQAILCWSSDVAAEEQEHAGNIIYGLSGEPRGSHMLETLLKLAPDEMHAQIVKCGEFENPTTLQAYAEHEVSNFVVQSLLTTIRTRDQAEIMLKSLEKIVSSGLVLDSSKKRRGIFWRAAELAAKFRVGQESLLKSMRLGFGQIGGAAQNVGSTDSEVTKKKQRQKALAVETKDCIPLLINLKLQDQEGGRVLIDVPGARAVHHLLRFAPRLCEGTLEGILHGFSPSDLELLIRDGLGSCCVIDGILDGPIHETLFANASKSLLSILKGRWVALSSDRVGHHTVKKLFHALPKIDDKSRLVEELVGGENRLNGNAMGRGVISACMVSEYGEKRKEWRKAVVSSQNKQNKILDAIIPDGKQKYVDGEEGTPKLKRPRKRRRQSAENTKADEVK